MKEKRSKKPIHKRWWFWALVVCLIVGAMSPDSEPAEPSETAPISTISPTEQPTTPPTEAISNQFDAEMPLSDFVEKVEELGYTATYYNQGVDYTEILGFYTSNDLDSLVIVSIEEDSSAKTVVVELLPKAFSEQSEAEQTLRSKLETGAAWVAAENHGETIYGESFELHYFSGIIAEYAEDENTWFLKAECTVNGADKVCEAKVIGTTDKPEVIYFDIY